MNTKKVALFGDSILKGVVLDTNGRYRFADIDWNSIEKRLNVDIVNKSKFGCEIKKGGKILSDSMSRESFDVAVIEYGGNDSDFCWGEVAATPFERHTSKTEVGEFEVRLEYMVSVLQDKGVKVVLMSLPPIDAERYFDWISQKDEQKQKNIMAFLGDVSRINRYQEMYSNAIVQVAFKKQCDLVDVRKKFLQSDDFKGLMCLDGIHPNEKGQREIISAFVEYFNDTALAKAN